MAETVDLRGVYDLPPEDALRYSRGKDYRVSRDWTDVWEGGHARHFTVAKVAQIDLLTAIRQSLDKALAEGRTFESWKTDIIPELEKAGWWGKVQNAAVTGTSEAIYVGPRRLHVIYDTNLRTARAAGQWARIQAAKDRRPYLRYSAILDRRTRPQHRAWHGTVLPVDHPWWQSHFPPNGWFCRCNVQQLSERDLTRYGYKITPVPPEGPATKYVSRTGFTADVPAGIDPGFGNNTGRSGLQAIVERAGEALQKASDAGLVAEARVTLQQMLDSAAVEQVLVDNQPGMPVAVLSDELLTLTGGSNRIATLSEWSMEHIQADRQRSFPAALYRALMAGLEQPRLRVLQDDGRILSVIEAEGRLYAVVLNPVPAKNELWLHTIFDVAAKDYPTLRRRGTILIDNL